MLLNLPWRFLTFIQMIILFSCNGGGGGSSGNSQTVTPDQGVVCEASIPGGNFSAPVNVNINCSDDAEIRYCLQMGSCCDPQLAGSEFISPIEIGVNDGEFCLSFFGQNPNGVSSNYQHIFKIDSSLPDLQLQFPQIYFQTTQLKTSYYLNSNDFGKNYFEANAINFKQQDPSQSNLDLNCQDIAESFISGNSPGSTSILNSFDLANISTQQQLAIPLNPSDLEYGDNFLFTYLINLNYAEPLFSCSINKIVLDDFNFFNSEISNQSSSASAGSLSGSFVPFNFFNSEPQSGETSSGVARSENSGQQLRFGSFGIFY